VENSKVYIKLLARSNSELESAVRLHTMTDIYGVRGGSGAGSAIEMGKGTGDWEEIIIKVNTNPDAKNFRQIHLYFAGTFTGKDFFREDGTAIKPDLYFDVAAWATFPNLESAKNFKLVDNI
jgi:hypothetical protein